MNTALEGHIRIDLDYTGTPRVAACRPLTMQQLLWHKTQEEVRARLGALYGVCRHAHGLASDLAYAELDANHQRHLLPLLRLRALFENIQEGLWHLCMVIPQALGRKPPVEHIARVRRAITTIVESPTLDQARTYVQNCMETLLSAETLLTVPQGAEADMLLAESRITGLPLPKLARFDEAAITRNLEWLDRRITEQPDFIARPHLPEGLAENTPGTTDRWAPLSSRIRQLAERTRWMILALQTDTPESALCAGARRLGERALAWVETSRGWLIHSLSLQDGRTRHYRIVAPTEWNFHPQGPVARCLMAAAEQPETLAEQTARLIALAWNPCVPVQIETAATGSVSHA